jgi:hypothetical protein
VKKILILITLTLLGPGVSGLKAQIKGESPITFRTSESTATSQVYKDSRIDLLIQKQVYINTMALRNLPGYRVQVISTMDRNKAMSAKAKLMQLFPDYQTYLSYQSPYFRVRIGDFRERNDALELQKELNNYFPNGVFTVRDIIHISPAELLQDSNDDTNN